jgi:serine/threonine protein kinase
MGDKLERTTQRLPEAAPAEPSPTEDVVGTGPNVAAAFPVGGVVASRFRILRFVGRGGMGEVYEALDSTLRTRVALKTLRAGSPEAGERLARLKREVVLARQVSHPNVCRMFEFFEQSSGDAEPDAFITMEFLEGETLQARLKRVGPMNKAEGLPLLEQMADGLEAIHAQGIVHRDFKSSNVMLVPSPEGLRAVVTDFGIAHREGVGETLTGGSVVVGTPAYMAPEVRAGEEATVRSDVYAFGVVACELLAGQLPVNGMPVGTKGRTRRVLARATALDSERRFPRPASVVEGLKRAPHVTWRVAPWLVVLTLVLGFFAAGPAPKTWLDRLPGRIQKLGTVTPASGELAALYSQGLALNRALRWVDAVPVLQDVVHRQPNLVPAYLDLVDALDASGGWQRSRELIQEAMRRGAQLSPGLRLAAEARYWNSVGDPERARGLARRLYELEPQNDEVVLYYLGLLESGPALELVDRLRTSHSSVLQDPRLDLAEAIHSVQVSDPTRALEALARAEDKTTGIENRFLHIRVSDVRVFLALTKKDFGQMQLLLAPIEDFYRSEGYRFEEAKTIRRKANALWMSGARDDAISAGFRAIDILKQLGPNPELVNTSANLGVLLALNGRTSLSRRAIGASGDVPDVLLRRSKEFMFASALIARENGDLPLASSLLDTAILSYPESPLGMLAMKAWIYIDQDRREELEQHLEEWVHQGRKELSSAEKGFVALVLSDASLSAGKPKVASALLRTLPPEAKGDWNDEVLLDESYLALLEGRPAAAVRLATEALRSSTHEFGSNVSEAARLQLARAYKAAGQETQAASLLDALKAEAEREGRKPLALEVRLALWRDSLTGPSRHHEELKRLEADATRAGFLRIARLAREAAAR